MDNSFVLFDDLSIDEINYILEKHWAFLIQENPSLGEVESDRVSDEQLNFELLKQTMTNLAENDPEFAKNAAQWLTQYAEESSSKDVLADMGITTGAVLITSLAMLIAAQMNADDNRKNAPDKVTKPDGEVEERKYFDMATVLGKIQEIIGAVPKAIWDNVTNTINKVSGGKS